MPVSDLLPPGNPVTELILSHRELRKNLREVLKHSKAPHNDSEDFCVGCGSIAGCHPDCEIQAARAYLDKIESD